MDNLMSGNVYVEKWKLLGKLYYNDAITMRGVKILNQFPAADVTQVVRCRDCKHMTIQSNARFCTVWNGINGMGDDGFCNYGERKEGADNGS